MEKLVKQDILSIIGKNKNNPGIDVNRLKTGTKLKIKTINSLYEFEVLPERGYLLAQGGKYIKEKQVVWLTGSTYGGSMLRIGWISLDMHMEIWIGKRKLTTSCVKNAMIIGDNWKYSLGD